jgi:hypothetical protein
MGRVFTLVAPKQSTSDILGGATTELFSMYVQVFRPIDKLRSGLIIEIARWKTENHSSISAHAVLQAVAERLRSSIEVNFGLSAGALESLQAALNVCMAEDERADDASCLSLLYGRLAPIFFAIEQEIPRR